jgi:hypothetical protein
MLAVKVTFLNDELTEAQLQRGIWWWKRLALVRLVTEDVNREDCPPAFRTAWKFVASGEECSRGLAEAISSVQAREKLLRLEAKDWQRPRQLPKAQVRQLRGDR